MTPAFPLRLDASTPIPAGATTERPGRCLLDRFLISRWRRAYWLGAAAGGVALSGRSTFPTGTGTISGPNLIRTDVPSTPNTCTGVPARIVLVPNLSGTRVGLLIRPISTWGAGVAVAAGTVGEGVPLVAEAENQTAKQSAAGRSFLEREVSVLSDPPACRDLSLQSRDSPEWRTVGWFR